MVDVTRIIRVVIFASNEVYRMAQIAEGREARSDQKEKASTQQKAQQPGAPGKFCVACGDQLNGVEHAVGLKCWGKSKHLERRAHPASGRFAGLSGRRWLCCQRSASVEEI